MLPKEDRGLKYTRTINHEIENGSILSLVVNTSIIEKRVVIHNNSSNLLLI